MPPDEVRFEPIELRPVMTAHAITLQHREALDNTRRQMTVALERRRRELERALHDGAQQQLLALRMEILRVVDACDRDHGEWGVLIAGVVARLDGALEDLARLASGKRPRALNSGNLVDALRELAAISGAAADVHVLPAVVVDEASLEVIAFVVSEALANAQQHSNATNCTVTVVPDVEGLRIDVVDDGRGGASIVPGRGIDGLRRRAEALGGNLEVFSDEAGTLVRLHLPQASVPLRAQSAATSEIEKEGSMVEAFGRVLGDERAQVWFWCEASGATNVSPPGTWRNSYGDVLSLASSERSTGDVKRVPPNRLVRLVEGDRPLALVATEADIERVATLGRDHLGLLVEGRERARAASTLALLREEHDRIARRSLSFEDALRRRLTDRPREELLAARGCLTGSDPSRRRLAAEHVANATELLREIVRRLRVPESEWNGAARTLATTLERIARRARIRLDLDADDLDDETASAIIERVAEEVMLDASPRAEVLVRVRAHRRHATVSIALKRLPSPVAIALIEELALSSNSNVTFRPSHDGVRLLLEVPCAS